MQSIRFFACARYRTALLCTAGLNGGIFAAWHMHDQGIMRQNFSLSWQGVTEKRRFWTIWTSHFSHCRVEHLIENLIAFMCLGYALQKVFPMGWLGGHLLFVPLITSGASLAHVYALHGPEEAKDLRRKYPDLDWNNFCHYRFLELRSGLRNELTSRLCGIEKLGIQMEATASELASLFQPYQRWYHESARSKLGMSAITLSLQGFGTAWFMHLGLSGLWNPIVAIGLGLLTFQPAMDIASLNSGELLERDESRFGMGPGVDIAGHLSGFGCGALSYLLRYRVLGKLIVPAFARSWCKGRK